MIARDNGSETIIRDDASKPLADLVVIELGHSVAAPFAGQILADLGAKVVKVERPGDGDDARQWGPPFWHGAAATFQGLNRNKLSVAIDLKDASEREALVNYITEQADVVLQNLRPGLVTQLGLDYETLKERNPSLIYCNLGAFGDTGPLKNSTGYDPLVQAFSGIMSVTGEENRPPVRVGPSIIDMGAGMWSVIGILSALTHRILTGKGCRVDTSLFETALSWMTIPFANTLASGRSPGRTGSETPMLAPYKAFRAKDRYLVIAAGNDSLFRKLCDTLGYSGWASDPRFTNNASRVKNRDALNQMIEGALAAENASVWVSRLDAVGVPCALMQSIEEVLSHPQTAALEMIVQPKQSELRVTALPIRFDGVRPEVRSAPPAVGEHNAILSSELSETDFSERTKQAS